MIPRPRMSWPAALVALVVLAVSGSALADGDLTTYDTGLSDMPDMVDQDQPSDHELLLPLGPLVIERGPKLDRNAFFPLFYQQIGKGDHPYSFLGVAPFYFRYRGGEGGQTKADVAFPFLWLKRTPSRLVLTVPPFFLEKWKGDGAYRAGVAPLLFLQRTPGLDFTVVPPVFFHFGTDSRKFVLATLFYYHRHRSDVDMGLPPIFFNGWNDKKGYLTIFPLVWHFENYVQDRSDTVVGPVWFGRRQNDWQLLLTPLIFMSGGESGGSFNLIPLFHWDSKKGGTRIVSPLGWYWKNPEKKVKGGGFLLYHQYDKGDFRFRTFAPFWFHWRSENMFRKSHFIFPVGYFDSGPIHRNVSVLGLVWDFHRFDEHRTTVVLPLFAHDKDLYREKHTTWVFPTFQYTKEQEKWQFNFHPLVYWSGGEEKTHQVIFPVWWRFAKPGKITQIAFPLWWDFQNLEKKKRGMSFFPFFWKFKRPQGDHTVILNGYYYKGEGKKNYRFVLFPLFGFGENQKSKYWKVLLGLVGFRKTELKDTLYLFWLPIKVRDDTPAPAAPAPEPAPAQ